MSDFDYLYFDSIDSTNTEAKRRIADGRISGATLLVARTQTAGRGRQGKSFYSPPDTGVYMTVVIPMNCPISGQVGITTVTAVEVAQAIEEVYGIVPEIKWVNDIYVNGRKCCGILCEAVNDYEAGIMRYAVIGVGINVSTNDWPDDLRNIAGSLNVASQSADSGCPEIAERVAQRLVNLGQWTRPLIPHGTMDPSPRPTWDDGPVPPSHMEYYRGHSNVLGREISFTENGSVRYGKAMDIDTCGGLVVAVSENGREERITLNSGEITVRVQK